MFSIVKWTGSKRLQAKRIGGLFPEKFGTYYEPFLGGGNILLAGLSSGIISRAMCCDVCKPLIEIWKKTRDDPDLIVREYIKRFRRFKEI